MPGYSSPERSLRLFIHVLCRGPYYDEHLLQAIDGDTQNRQLTSNISVPFGSANFLRTNLQRRSGTRASCSTPDNKLVQRSGIQLLARSTSGCDLLYRVSQANLPAILSLNTPSSQFSCSWSKSVGLVPVDRTNNCNP